MRRTIAALLIATACGVTASSLTAQQRRVERPVPFAAGERLEYDVSYSSYVSAGTVVLQVAEKKPSFGSTAYYVVAEARTSPLLSRMYTLYYKADSLIDVYSLLPQRGSIFSREGSRQRMKITSFDHGKKQARFEMQTASKMQTDVAIPTTTQDALSVIYALRANFPQPGGRLAIPVTDGGRMYQAQFSVGARETIRLGSRDVGAFRVTPTVAGDKGDAIARGAAMWISDDARRLPLRIDVPLAIGRIVLSLRIP